jgi:hypothetical protein
MDSSIEKSFEIANYMATLASQHRIILEEFNQKCLYYINGATFKITVELISFTKTILDLGHTENIAFLDSNNLPIIIQDVQEFFDTLVSNYYEALNEYTSKYNEIKTKRSVKGLVPL